MHIKKPKWKSKNGKTYQSVWLCESYRENGKSKSRYVANLKNCPPQEITALEFALKHADDLDRFVDPEKMSLRQGRSVGAVWTVVQSARQLGIPQALGTGFQAQLALWQIVARVIEQGSRLSAVRLHEIHALADVLALRRGFDENALYENLAWLTAHQDQIEQRLFSARHGEHKPTLFLYDVTSSYLEGDHNALGAFGYNRDGKRGKKQIVVGLLCDAQGEPVSVQVFAGNTQDVNTFCDQVKKVAERFDCQRVTFVGDRGMIKSGQIEQLSQQGFYYLSALTKPQLRTLLRQEVVQMDLFDEQVCEVLHSGVRYILRRNSHRAAIIAHTRADKRVCIEAFVARQNSYLAEHPKAKVELAHQRVVQKIERLRGEAWLRVAVQERHLTVQVDEEALQDLSQLDGCYVLRTDLPASVADTDAVHQRYKDLAKVERAFRLCKTGQLELRPIYVRSEASTRGHVLVVMLAYLIRRQLEQAWRDIDMTVEEGLDALKQLCCMEIKRPGLPSTQIIPKPSRPIKALIDKLAIRMPKALPLRTVNVGTRKKLPGQRSFT